MFTIYGTDTCKYCKDAKNFLLERAEPFKYVRVEDNVEEFKENFPGVTSVPQILYDDKYWIEGGFEGMRNLWYSGPREFWFTPDKLY